ncbi:MAG TPA: MATE family efflux transporter, partial [Caulobacteraceae bacterium]|nr:MATE family efflux transporter [Caulobacteraceae bacterium]
VAVAMWIANGVNLALNLALVPGGGAIGSAWATVLSRLLLALALPAYMLAVGPVRRLLAGPAAVGGSGYGPLLRIGAAAALSGLVESSAFSAMAVIAARHGGAVAVAVFTVATGSLLTLVYLLAQGLATAAVVLVSEAMGAGNEQIAARIGWTALALTFAATGACGAACLALSPQVARAFTADGATQAGLVSTMGLIALLMIPDGGQGPADATLRARGQNWFPTAARFIAFVLLAPLLAIWLAPRMAHPAEGVLLALLIASTAALAALVARMATARAPA